MGFNAVRNHAEVPLISIILVCRNPGPRLRDALASAWHQRDADAEIVVIDGASTDGSREWLEAQRTRLGVLVSEPDGGVYAAMNKGIAAARGDWVVFLGSDDQFASPETLAQAGEVLRGTPAGIVAGTARFTDGRRYAPRPEAAIRRNFVHHQATFYHRSLFARHAAFDLRLGIQADYDLNLRFLRAGIQFTALPRLVAHCGTGGLSDGGRWENYREEITVRHRYFPLWRSLPWDFVSVARYFRKSILHSSA